MCPSQMSYTPYSMKCSHRLPKKRSPQNKAIRDQNKLLFVTLAPTITSVLCSGLCLLVSGWFVTDKMLSCCDETSKPSAPGQLRKSVTWAVSDGTCLCIIGGSKVLGPHLACTLLRLNLSMGMWPSCFPFRLQVAAAAATLPCFLSFKLILSALNRNPVWLFVFLKSTCLLEMGEGEEWNQNYQLGLQE